MTREDILELVKEYIAEAVEDVDVSNLDTTKSMKDHGVNSLDIVEVVSRSMRTLKVKVPRSELNKLQNIDGLIDLLQKAIEDKEAAA